MRRVERSNALLAVPGTGEGASRGVNDGSGNQEDRGERERTHKTGKHVISLRRGERRGWGISRRLVPLLSHCHPSLPRFADIPWSPTSLSYLAVSFKRKPLFPCFVQSE